MASQLAFHTKQANSLRLCVLGMLEGTSTNTTTKKSGTGWTLRWLSVFACGVAESMTSVYGQGPEVADPVAIFASAADRNASSDLEEFKRVTLEGDFIPKTDGLPPEAMLAEIPDASETSDCASEICFSVQTGIQASIVLPGRISPVC